MRGALHSEILARQNSLPTMPAMASKVLRLLQDPESDAAQIEEVVRHAPGLTGNVLRLSNSAYFGFAGRIGSVRQAIVYLGWERMRQLVLATSIRGVMVEAIPGYGLPPGELWRHAVAVAVASEKLARALGIPAPEETFTAALLHDVGKLILGQYVEEYQGRIEEALGDGLSFETAEREVLGLDHAELGGEVLEKWSLPQGLVLAARWHHAPDAPAEDNVMLDIVHAADVLCLMLGIGIGRDGLGYEPSEAAMGRLGLRIADLEVVASELLAGIEELLDALSPKCGIRRM